MTKFKKSVLVEDRTYHSPDGKLVVNPKNKRHWVDKVAHFKASLFDIPVFWDHQKDPKLSQPIKRKSGKRQLRAKGQAGWLTNAGIADDGGLELEFDIPNEKDAQQVADNLTKVSPVIWDTFSDGRGVTHESVIGACDLVVHPVDDSQTNFTPVPAIACSLVRMSLDGKPVIYRLADDDDNSDHDSDDDDAENSDGSDRVARVIEGMAALNIIVPDDTTVENFFERVESALLTAAAMGDGVDMGTEGLEATSPEFAALGLDSPLGKFQSKQHQTGVMTRLNLLLQEGRCTPVEHKDRQGQVGKIRLSLNASGEHQPTHIEAWIESREAVPPGTFWDSAKRTRMSNMEVVPHPDGLAGDEVTEDQANEIVDEMFG